ncbi:hypothetical protein KDL29_10635 [bacterium]|nr:hypothetical protein [bacterium]MCB1219241.1 hypothetical protein [bacterium]UNM09544.1 MAG: hypothetical protein H7A35_05655 [Planctomycetales bacterium]
MKRGSPAEVDINELNMSVVRMRDEMDLMKEFSLQVSEGMQASTKLLVALQEMVCVVERRLSIIEQRLGLEQAESLEQVAERALEE